MSDPAALMRMAEGTLDLAGLSSEMRLRATAILARQALEGAIAAALLAEGADPSRMSFRTQLETLRHLRSLDGAAADAAFAWAALSRATHYHGYELPPTREALCDWMRLARGAAEALCPLPGEAGRE